MKSPVRVEIRDLTRIAIFAAIIAVLALPPAITPFGSAVPITAQTLGVMLAGTILGPWRGAAAVLVFEVLVAAGLPLLAGGRGGAGVFAGPSVGYLIGWIFGSFVIGLIAYRRGARPRWWRTGIAAIVGGIVVVYALGIPGVSLMTGIPLAKSAWTSLIFLPGDFLKVIIATAITVALWRAYPRAFGLPKSPAAAEQPTGA